MTKHFFYGLIVGIAASMTPSIPEIAEIFEEKPQYAGYCIFSFLVLIFVLLIVFGEIK